MTKALFVAVLFGIVPSLMTKMLFAYPSYISYGYQSCMACHYNPYGNGPLNDYGRAVGATAISDRAFWSKKASEEKIAEASGFWFKTPKQNYFRPSVSFRDVLLTTGIGDDNQKTSLILMDFSVSGVLKFLHDDRLIFVGNIGYAPVPQALKHEKDVKTYRSHEAYAGYRLTKEIGLYAGLMDKVFGIRIPDHIAYSRSLTGLTQYDQTHSALLHYLTENVEVGIQPFLGNMVQDATLRQEGVCTQVEVATSTFSRVGASFLTSHSDYVGVTMGAVHARAGIGEGNSILFETGGVKKLTAIGDTLMSNYSLTQAALNLRRGIFGLLTLEHMHQSKANDTVTYRIAPGIQYFPIQRLEIRFDVYDTIAISKTASSTSSIMTALQFHLWI